MWPFTRRQKQIKKSIDSGAFIGFDTPGNYLDSWGKQRTPDRQALIREYRNVAYACVNMNVGACIKPALKLYRKSRVGDKVTSYPAKMLRTGQVETLSKRVKLRVSDKERIEEITEHPLLTLLERPNEAMDLIGLMELSQLFMEITGTSYWYPVKDRLGVPREIYLLIPQFLKVVADTDTGAILYYEYGKGGAKQQYQPDELIAFLMPNPSNPWLDGQSPIKAVYESVNLHNKYAATEAAILDNSGHPDGILKAKDGLSEDEALRWERRFNNKFRKAGNGGVLILEEDAEFQPLTFPPRDLARLEIYNNVEKMICNAFGVPVPLLSKEGASQYGVQATLRNQHVEDAIIPRLRRNQSVLNHKLIPLFDDSRRGKLFLAYDDPSPENRELELKENTEYVKAGIWTQNEVRIRLGHEPHPDGDRLSNPIGTALRDEESAPDPTPEDETAPETTPEAPDATLEAPESPQDIQTLPDKTLNGAQISGAMAIVTAVAAGQLPRDTGMGSLQVLLNLTTEQAETVMGSAGLEPVEPKPEPPKPETPEERDSETPAEQEEEEDTGKEKPPKKSCSCNHSKAHHPGHTKKLPDGKALAAVLRKFFVKQKQEVLSHLHSHKSYQKALPDRFLHLPEWDRELYLEAQPLIELYYKDGYDETKTEIIGRTGISPDRFNVTNPHTAEKVKHLALQFCKETNATTSKELNKALDQLREDFEHGLADTGDRMSDLSERVKNVFDSAEDFRADRIAQTEASRSHHEATREAAKESGVCKGFELLLSSEACEECKAVADEGPIGLDDNFTQDDSAPEVYRDRFVPIHPNCECTVLCVLEGENA